MPPPDDPQNASTTGGSLDEGEVVMGDVWLREIVEMGVGDDAENVGSGVGTAAEFVDGDVEPDG